MGKFIKSIVAGVIALSMATWGTPLWAAVDQSSTINISVTIPGSTSLTISYLDTATGAAGTGTIGFDISSVTTSAPWVVGDECLLVTYSSNYAWGLRIITDNEDLEGDANDVIDSIAGQVLAPGSDGVYGTSDDVLAYSGLISASEMALAVADQDPNNRGALAWQGYDEWTSTYTSYLPTSSLVASGTGYYIDDTNVGDCWPQYDASDTEYLDDWHYIGDKNDSGFDDEIFDGSTDDLTYPIVAMGSAGSSGYLVPATGGNTTGDMVNLADSDVVILLTGKFAATDWGDSSEPRPHVLEPDTYSCSLYVELIHE